MSLEFQFFVLVETWGSGVILFSPPTSCRSRMFVPFVSSQIQFFFWGLLLSSFFLDHPISSILNPYGTSTRKP